MKVVFLVILLIHGLIHLIGHYNAYNPGKIDGMTLPVSRPYGFLWLFTAVLMLISGGLLAANLIYWWFAGAVSLVLSQFLVIRFWHDARYGTIGNVILLLGLVIGLSSWSFHREYREDFREGLQRTAVLEEEILTAKDLEALPQLVKNYLSYVGVVGKPRVYNFKVKLRAEMRSQGQKWFRMRAEQHNFLDEYERLFFLQARVKGMPVAGYHSYQDKQAAMQIKALSIFSLVEEGGPEMFIAETVTLFNDMCIMAPATLIDQNIRWEVVDDRSVRAYFTNEETTISAILVFNELGQLINFISDDRYDIEKKQKVRFSTPLSNYKEKNGYTLATYGEAIWHYPEGEFTYGKFKIRSVEYNVDPGKNF
jgi:hypothetical protein